MKQKNKLGFTLVELLVVITILAIISVVAYQNFGGAVDKAVGGRKISDVSTIETALQQYKSDKNYYPPVTESGANELWGYTGGVIAKPSNLLRVSYDGDALSGIIMANGGGKVYGTGIWATTSRKQIGAKGTISQAKLEKKYLSKDLYDPELGDLKLKDQTKLIEKGIGRYVYATFKKTSTTGDWTSNLTGNAYNIAYTVKQDGTDTYTTKIVGDYDKDSCFTDSQYCPDSLIGSGTMVLKNNDVLSGTLNTNNFYIPYAVTDLPN
ncbi:prepilin-type N-terminal cleavage/methylation domain-containing protein [Candidatus Gracilibacteria bacterium]|nr:prepilin-type N-terminal cleavage/methylation domain-containing protein [Candidatus Gracilibacteria bacterium]